VKRIAIAALSARVFAEQAAREGFEVVALDLFGDRDTRRAAARWLPIGEAHALRIDGERLLAALQECARSGAAQGWLFGSGLDGRPDLLAAGAERLPLIGNDAGTVRRVRDAGGFFGALAAHGIAHPPVRATAPPDLHGWLVKDSAECGGTHVRRATAPIALGPTQYLQRELDGTPLSATFVADGRAAVVLGCNEQIVQAHDDAPYLYSGLIGPLPHDGALQAQVDAALEVLVPAFGLRGLGSLDLLYDGAVAWVLEINPRPSASVALYAARDPVRSHLRACIDGVLPPPRPGGAAGALHGTQIVFAPRALTLDPRAADWLAAQPDIGDLPSPAAFDRDAPLCSVDAEGRSVTELRRHLAARRETVLAALEGL
jgi:uncharacterized protein